MYDLKFICGCPNEIGTSLSLCKLYEFVSFCLETCCRDLAISIVRYELKQKGAVRFRFDALQLLCN